MDKTEKIETDFSLLNEVGENYHYVKTIINNRVEVIKLELLQFISKLVSFFALGILMLFFAMIVVSFCIAILVVFLAEFLSSYLFALLLTFGIILIVSLILYIILKPIFLNYIELKLMSIASFKNHENDDNTRKNK